MAVPCLLSEGHDATDAEPKEGGDNGPGNATGAGVVHEMLAEAGGVRLGTTRVIVDARNEVAGETLGMDSATDVKVGVELRIGKGAGIP